MEGVAQIAARKRHGRVAILTGRISKPSQDGQRLFVRVDRLAAALQIAQDDAVVRQGVCQQTVGNGIWRRRQGTGQRDRLTAGGLGLIVTCQFAQLAREIGQANQTFAVPEFWLR